MKELSPEDYINAPCAASSLPYWKAGRFVVPEGMLVIRDDQYKKEEYPQYEDTPYFKLIHSMKDLQKPILPKEYSAATAGFAEFSAHIRCCYGGGPSEEELALYAERPSYDPALWVAVADETGSIAGSGIAELDARIGEGIIEWVQVSKGRRRRGLGEYLVRELLYRMKGLARFTTVSGEVNNASDPLALYEKCGFGGKVIWHVLKEKDQWT